MKKIVLQLTKFAYFFTCGWYLFTPLVHAYIDPSAVTYIIQAVAGVLIALGAILTVFRHKIFAFFKKNKKTDESEKQSIEFKDVND